MPADAIPRVIFQTWRTRDVPEQWNEAHRSVLEKNPGWKHVLLTDEDCAALVAKHFPSLLATFHGFKYNIQRADFIRYVVLYLYGGVYLDLDYVALKAFDGITLPNGKEVGLLASNNTPTLVTNSFMVSKPRSAFWLDCLAETTKPPPWWAIGKHMHVFHQTGPFMVNRVMRRHRDIAHRLEGVSAPCDVCTLDSCTFDATHFVKPIKGDSWHSWDSTLINAVHCNRPLAACACLGFLLALWGRSPAKAVLILLIVSVLVAMR